RRPHPPEDDVLSVGTAQTGGGTDRCPRRGGGAGRDHADPRLACRDHPERRERGPLRGRVVGAVQVTGSTFDVPRSRFGVRGSAFVVRCSSFVVRRWSFIAAALVAASLAGWRFVPAAAQQEFSARAAAAVTFLQINDVYTTVPIEAQGGLARVATLKQNLAK